MYCTPLSDSANVQQHSTLQGTVLSENMLAVLFLPLNHALYITKINFTVSGKHPKLLLLFYVFIMNEVPIIKGPCFKTEFRNNFHHKKLCYFLLSQFYFIHTENS